MIVPTRVDPRTGTAVPPVCESYRCLPGPHGLWPGQSAHSLLPPSQGSGGKGNWKNNGETATKSTTRLLLLLHRATLFFLSIIRLVALCCRWNVGPKRGLWSPSTGNKRSFARGAKSVYFHPKSKNFLKFLVTSNL